MLGQTVNFLVMHLRYSYKIKLLFSGGETRVNIDILYIKEVSIQVTSIVKTLCYDIYATMSNGVHVFESEHAPTYWFF